MNRKEAAELLPFIKAFSEGKDIEMRSKNPHAQLNGWAKIDEFIFGNFEYRIKPESKYYPFKDAKECWQEMQKHQPIGWVKCKDNSIPGKFMHITSVRDNEVTISSVLDISYNELIKYYTFTDGTPLGVKEEE